MIPGTLTLMSRQCGYMIRTAHSLRNSIITRHSFTTNGYIEFELWMKIASEIDYRQTVDVNTASQSRQYPHE